MAQSSTLSVGLDVHQESSAVAYVAQAHHAEVISLGTIGTRPCDIDPLIRTLPSKSQQLVCVYTQPAPAAIGSLGLSPHEGTAAGSSPHP
jgi:hypothetical protein